jgi:hypothetical protein
MRRHNSNRRGCDRFDGRPALGQCGAVPSCPPPSLRSSRSRPGAASPAGRAVVFGLVAALVPRPSPATENEARRLLAFTPWPEGAHPALAAPPPGLTIIESRPAIEVTEVPTAVQRAGASGAIWIRILSDDRIGLRYWDARERVLHESAIPAPHGTRSAVSNALWLRFEFMMALPPAAGRPWPPPEPVVPALRPELVAAWDTPPPDPWPPFPAFSVPPLPPPPAAPVPRGEVEVTVSALPGAPRAPIGVAATPDLLPSGTPDADLRGAPGHRVPRVALRFEVGLPSPVSLGGSLRGTLPLGHDEHTGGAAVVGAVGLSTWHPAYSGKDGGALGTPALAPRGELGLGAAWGLNELRLHVSATAALSRLIVPSDTATVDDAWQGALRLGTAVGWALGSLTPSLGLELALSPWVLSMHDGPQNAARQTILADRLRIGLLLGLGYAFPP